ncbi:hypothetical protein C2G38_2174650 [Gigaspora rosea]|uniref:Uncharacterized protein n=1 Tax=Gigaspora rosea TaxID=44941 RepID=A0A397VLE6_9GLOM|nr:hypothetical protein C2G38_2174650 [Gigaspora rosea]
MLNYRVKDQILDIIEISSDEQGQTPEIIELSSDEEVLFETGQIAVSRDRTPEYPILLIGIDLELLEKNGRGGFKTSIFNINDDDYLGCVNEHELTEDPSHPDDVSSENVTYKNNTLIQRFRKKLVATAFIFSKSV